MVNQPTSALSVAGSGDVLSGVMGALSPAGWLYEAACAAVWAHNAAGHQVAELGDTASTASDLIDARRSGRDSSRRWASVRVAGRGAALSPAINLQWGQDRVFVSAQVRAPANHSKSRLTALLNARVYVTNERAEVGRLKSRLSLVAALRGTETSVTWWREYTWSAPPQASPCTTV